MKRHIAKVAPLAYRFLPRVETLEDRVQLGDTLLGLSVVTLGGFGFRSWDTIPTLSPDPSERWRQDDLLSIEKAAVLVAAALVPTTRLPSGEASSATMSDHTPATRMPLNAETFSLAISWDADALAGQRALYRLGGRGFPVLPASELTLGQTAAGNAVSRQEDARAIFALASPEIGEPATHAPLASAADSPLAFDRSTGQLVIRTAAGEHTVRETQSTDGFVDVTVNGQEHSSNPRSAFFDHALAGAAGATVAGIRFAGGSQDTLIVSSQHRVGPMRVQATGATVVTQNVSATGSLAIQAANITVDGSLQGSSVFLAASDWVTVNATGRVETAPEASGGIRIAAARFVNSGQLRADGRASGLITVQADNVLNAGPITANATVPDGTAGQVRIAFTGAYLATAGGMVSASSAAGPGGEVILDGGSTGRLYTSGQQRATGSVGGAVDLFGRDILFAAATVDASGVFGGGSVRIGSRVPEQRPVTGSTETVTVTAASTIRADAQRAGTGGRVSIGAEGTVAFDGTVSARGGSAGGGGGFIEISGHGNLSYGGSADAGARLGKSGTLLLDPKNLVISAAPIGVLPQYDLLDPHPTAGGSFSSHLGILSTGNILVANPKDNFGGTNAGAVYLFNELTGALLSALVGSSSNDQIGSLLAALGNGNYLVISSSWNGNLGAVTWGDGTSGTSGVVSESNSLVGGFPGYVQILGNGNYLAIAPFWNARRGAVTWGNGSTGVSGTISEANSLVGGNPGDLLGYESDGLIGTTILSNGNYVVHSPQWNGNRGAATWGDSNTGITGVVSEANSLVGSNPGDQVSFSLHGILALKNGNYLVKSGYGNRGAVTWGSGTFGITGTISEANSLVGSQSGDGMNSYLAELSNGNYLVVSPAWNGKRGAVTWASGTSGISGPISDANSFVGISPTDAVGEVLTPLSNGNYLIVSSYGTRGAATWADGSLGISGTISEANSLVGSNPGDSVGFSNTSSHVVTALSNGNYVIGSPGWNGHRGAATWGDGTQGITGVVSDVNSLVGSNPGDGNMYGSNPGDQVGGYVTALKNGNYVVGSGGWNGKRGALTWGDGTLGITGVVSEANSLVGNIPNETIPVGVTPLSNGNYLVDDPGWNGNRGAVTWASGTSGITGTISEANSLVGSNPGDASGYGTNPGDNVGGYPDYVTLLSNGNYLVNSEYWNGARGAVTWANGSIGIHGVVSEANSLVGSNPGDRVGHGFGEFRGPTALSNGNYVLASPSWNAGRGAATWGDGTTGVSGTISETNSLVGSKPGDYVGGGVPGAFEYNGEPGVVGLGNGKYIVRSPSWDSRGALTWANGSTGITGTVSEANSLVGTGRGAGEFRALGNGNYVALNAAWNGNRGAITWVNGANGQTLDGIGMITPQNSLLGRSAMASLTFSAQISADRAILATSPTDDGGGRVTIGLTDPNQLVFARDPAGTQTLTPAFLTQTLNSGTAVVLQASNDLIVNAPILVSAGGQGGALTLQAGRSILLNASIRTDNGPLALIANETPADGVVDAQRDPGQAGISMASGTTLDTGSAPLTVELREGAGLTNADSGPITLQTVTAGSLSVINNGPSPASDIILGAVTTTGPQSFANPHGTTRLTANMTAADNPITFMDSVVLNADLTFSTGSGTTTFAGGTVMPELGVVHFTGGVLLTGSTTFTSSLNGTDSGSYAQLVVSGPIDLGGSALSLNLGFEPPVGSSFEMLTNTGGAPISGTFAGLDEGMVFTQTGYTFQITYQGGTGGDSVVVTRLS